MSPGFEWTVALRYLAAARRHSLISLISLICVSGVALGVTVLISVLGVMAGFDRDLRDRILGTNAHLFVMDPFDRTLRDYRRACETVAKIPRVVACTPYAVSQVMLKFEQSVTGAVLWGIDPASIGRVTELKKYLQEGDLAALSRWRPAKHGKDDPAPLFVGKELARKYFLSVGEELTVVAPVFRSSAAGMIPRTMRFRVAGIFTTGFYEYDTTYVYAGLTGAQRLLDIGDAAHGLEVKVDDLWAAKAIGREIRERTQHRLWVQDWMDRNRNLFEALLVERWTMGIILFFLVLLAAFNIVGLLIMVVLDKTGDIGVLTSLGATPSQVRRVFVIQGTLIGVIGTALGVGGGLLVCVGIAFFEIPIPGGGSVYYINRLPVQIEPVIDLVVIPLLSVLASFVATLYPASRAAALSPVDAMRYE